MRVADRFLGVLGGESFLSFHFDWTFKFMNVIALIWRFDMAFYYVLLYESWITYWVLIYCVILNQDSVHYIDYGPNACRHFSLSNHWSLSLWIFIQLFCYHAFHQMKLFFVYNFYIFKIPSLLYILSHFSFFKEWKKNYIVSV